MKKKTKIILIVVISILHLALAITVMLASFEIVMDKFDTGAPLSTREQIVVTASQVLLSPLFYPLGSGRIFLINLSFLGPFLILLNSLAWAWAIVFLIDRIISKKKYPGKTVEGESSGPPPEGQ
jgi:hypothetical protein